jgi:alkylhydroperoxidase family enzyme
MPNTRGFLSQVDPATLDERHRRLLARWSEDAYDDHNLLLTMARRPGMLDAILGFTRYMFRDSLIEPELTELVRVRTAWNNRCRH